MPFPINNQATGDMSTVIDLIKQFFPFAQKRFGFNKPLNALNLVSDQGNATNPIGNTAYYDPTKMSITIYVDGRHPKDILRSFSHELVHHTQNCNGELSTDSDMGEGYAQRDPQMRGHEKSANMHGAMAVRDYADLSKQGTIYNNNESKEKDFMSTTNEKTLRQAIRHVIKEALKNIQLIKVQENEETGVKPWENLPPNPSAEEMLAAIAAYMEEHSVERTQGLGAGYVQPDISWKGQGSEEARQAALAARRDAAGTELDPDAPVPEEEEELETKEVKETITSEDKPLEEHKRRRRQYKKQRREEAWGKAPAIPETPKTAPAPVAVKEEKPGTKKAKKKEAKQPLKEWYDVSLYNRLVERYTK